MDALRTISVEPSIDEHGEKGVEEKHGEKGVAAFDAVIDRICKIEVNEVFSHYVGLKRATRNALRKGRGRQDMWPSDIRPELERRLYGDKGRVRAVATFSPYAAFAMMASRYVKDATWFVYPFTNSMIDALAVPSERRFIGFMTRLAAADLTPRDLVVVDFPSFDPARTALVLSGVLAALPRLLRDGSSVLYLKTAVPRTPGSPLAAMYDLFFSVFSGVDVAVELNNARPMAVWEVELRGFDAAKCAAAPCAAAAAAVRESCVLGLPSPKGGRAPSEKSAVMRYSAAAHRALAAHLGERIENAPRLPRALWRPPPLRSELPMALYYRGHPESAYYRDDGGAAAKDFDGLRDVEYMTYHREARDFQPSCHWGQLKLLLSEVQFLDKQANVIKAARAASTPVIALYVGSADGMHIPILVDMFPAVDRWILYDGARFSDALYRIKKVSVRRSFFTDDTARDLRREAAGGCLLYISDIRTEPTEERVRKEMVDQARWGVHLRAAAMLLKFRPPWPDLEGEIAVDPPKPAEFVLEAADKAAIKRAVKAKLSREAGLSCADVAAGGDFLYLKGEIQPQLFARVTSTETRLIVTPDPKTGKYAMEFLNPFTYEACCNGLNETLRRRGHRIAAPLLDMYLPGHDRGWESSQEYLICRRHLEAWPKDGGDKDVAAETMRLMLSMETRLSRACGGRTLARCVAMTYVQRSRKPPTGDTSDIMAAWIAHERVHAEETIDAQRRRIRLHGPAVLGAAAAEAAARSLGHDPKKSTDRLNGVRSARADRRVRSAQPRPARSKRRSPAIRRDVLV